MVLNRVDFKRFWRFVFWCIAVVLALNLGWLVYRGVRPPKAQAASGRSYTVLRTEKGFDKEGSLRYTNQYVEAQRADGSNMWSATTSLVQQRRITFANGDQILTNELLHKQSTYPKKYSAVPTRRDPEAYCSTSSDVQTGWVIDGTDSVGGYRAVRLALVTPKRTMKAWHALDAGCALLQQRLEHEDGVTEQNLTSLVLGEPDRTLFQVPTGIQEVPPSGLYEPVCYGGKCSSIPDSVKQRLDNKYYEIRAKTP